MNLAFIMAMRSTCSRRKVGAVLVTNNRIVSTGYNGAPSGRPHCIDGGCPRGKFTHDEIPKDADYNQFPCVAVHAEANAILFSPERFPTESYTLYVTEPPCQQCTNLIQAAGIGRVVVHGQDDARHDNILVSDDGSRE